MYSVNAHFLFRSVKIPFYVSQAYAKFKARHLKTLHFPVVSSILPSCSTKLIFPELKYYWMQILSGMQIYMRKHQRKQENRVKKMACTDNQGHRQQQWNSRGHGVSIETGACATLGPQHRSLKSGRPYTLIIGGGQQGHSTSDGLFLFLQAQQEGRLQLWDTLNQET